MAPGEDDWRLAVLETTEPNSRHFAEHAHILTEGYATIATQTRTRSTTASASDASFTSPGASRGVAPFAD